jgi:predicted esterase
MTDLSPLHITVPRTARYYLLGTPSALVRDVWVACHGYSQLAAQLAVPFHPFVDSSRLIVLPEGLSRFYVASTVRHTKDTPVGATWMTREDRDAEINDIVTYLDTLYDRILELLASHGVSRETIRVHALGFSQGAPVAGRWTARGAAVVDHLVFWAGEIPQDVNLRAIHERRPTLECDVIYGTEDPYITPKIASGQEAVLAASGVPYRIQSFEGGHTLNSAILHDLIGKSRP